MTPGEYQLWVYTLKLKVAITITIYSDFSRRDLKKKQ